MNILPRLQDSTTHICVSVDVDSHALAQILSEPNSQLEVTRLPYGAEDTYSIGKENRLEEAYIEHPARLEDQVIEAYKRLIPQKTPEPKCEISFESVSEEFNDPDSLLNTVCAYLVHKREPFFAYAFTRVSASSILVGVYTPQTGKVLRP